MTLKSGPWWDCGSFNWSNPRDYGHDTRLTENKDHDVDPFVLVHHCLCKFSYCLNIANHYDPNHFILFMRLWKCN